MRFFKKVTSYSTPIEETITCGLDEIKAEIREDLKLKMDEEIKHKLQNAESALAKNDELLKEHKTLTYKNNYLSENNKRLTEQCDELIKKLTHIEDGNEIIDMIRDVLKNGYGIWNKSKILDNIVSLIK